MVLNSRKGIVVLISSQATGLYALLDNFHTLPLLWLLAIRGFLSTVEELFGCLCHTATTIMETYYDFREKREALRIRYLRKS
jgi:hypothetical protein